jgi:catechol 2,3-dioxygenase-like lactoylglutathione lyase family enzyme
MNLNESAVPLRLKGVDHTARPTWKLKETVEFYRDVVGLPLVHTISAHGWGPATHPDFLHFFFDSGNGSTIAFFYYLGADTPAYMADRPGRPPIPDDHVFDATHTSWLVDSQEELMAWKHRLEQKGLEVSTETRHEVIESIYFRDPNGYFIEITRKLRALGPLDAKDAALTLAAAIQLETGANTPPTIEAIWNRKAELLNALQEEAAVLQ